MSEPRDHEEQSPGEPDLEGHQGMSDTTSDPDDGPGELFTEIMASIRQENISTLCAAIRTKYESKEYGSTHDTGSVLPTVEEPIFGAYHALFPVQFHDGIKWILKIPAQGTVTRFDNAASEALVTEATTMMFLRRSTSIPVPEIFAYQATLDNEIGCPFILMKFVDGVSLSDFWFSDTDDRPSYRTQVLKDIAAAMAQLDRFRYNSSGSLIFDEDGNPKDIGPMRCIDQKATLDRVFADGVDEVCYFNPGPFSEAGQFYTLHLDNRTDPADAFGRGIKLLLRLFLQWVPEPNDSGSNFVLAHPDFDIQNFIVSKDGHLLAVIDWDGIAAVPRSVGYESYPAWLTRDWDPAIYAWTEDMEDGINPEDLWEDSPTTLARHRDEYREFLQAALSVERRHTAWINPAGNDEAQSAARTTNSLYMENLLIATSYPQCTFPTLQKFMSEINKIVGREQQDELDAFDIVNALGRGGLEGGDMALLERGFHSIFQTS